MFEFSTLSTNFFYNLVFQVNKDIFIIMMENLKIELI